MNANKSDSVLEQLKTEHRIVEELLEQAEKADPSERISFLSEIEKNLVSHARAEEKTVYSLFYNKEKSSADIPDSDGLNLINEAYEEHHVVDLLLKELKNIDVEDEAWLAKLKVLKENVQHHVEEEEEELFKKVQENYSKDKLREMLPLYMEAKQQFEVTLPTQRQISERKPSASASQFEAQDAM